MVLSPKIIEKNMMALKFKYVFYGIFEAA